MKAFFGKVSKAHATYKDVFSGGVLLIFAVIMFINAFSIRSRVEVTVDAAFFPKMTTVLLMITSISIIVNGIRRKGEEDSRAASVLSAETMEDAIAFTGMDPVLSEPNENVESIDKTKTGREKTIAILSMGLIIFAYMFLINILGFIASTILFMFVACMFLTEKETRKKQLPLIIIVSVVLTLVVYYVFRYLFYMMLPMGIFK